jgi:tight adherence protein B
MGAGAAMAGVGGACGAALLAVAGYRYWESRREARRRLTHATAFYRGIRSLVSELRSGGHPVAAVEAAAVDAPPEVHALFSDLASATRLDAEITAVLARPNPACLRAPTGRLVRAWALAQRHGVALADLLEAVGRDVEEWSVYLRDREAKMAGPRASAAVVSGLPIMGLFLGEAVGAAPIAVLTGTLLGQVVLVTGIGLLCLGMWWTVRLTEAGVRW